jgi:hypothetical protein
MIIMCNKVVFFLQGTAELQVITPLVIIRVDSLILIIKMFADHLIK